VRTVRSLVVGAIVTVTVLAGAGRAWAHAALEPSTAAPGSVITLTLEVANEISGQSTTKVQLLFPDGMPIPVVELPPVPGWTANVEGGSLGADSTATGVTWSRPSGPVNEAARLPIRLGPLPETAQRLQFPVLQTYSNGEEVRWIEPSTEEGEEPEHPMPVLTLVPGGPGDPAPPPTAASTTTAPATSSTTGLEATTTARDEGDDDEGDDGPSDALIVAGLLTAVVVIGAGIAFWVRARNRRDAGPPAGPAAGPPEGPPAG
jgi:periplasmic copper chaperone A